MRANERLLYTAVSFIIAFFLISLSVNYHLSHASGQRRLALVIGNGAYRSAPLKNSQNDARDMAAALKKLGFEVMLYQNAKQREMHEAIRDFGQKLSAGGVGLFYFAGHGVQVKGRNYLIPIGAKIRTESEVRYESVDAGRVLGQMEDAGNSLNIVILDACRDNPFARSFRSFEKGLARMDAPTGSLIAYATGPGQVAADGEGRNGTYTKNLLKHMMKPGQTVEQMFKLVRIDVMNETGKMQIPWESTSLIGNFYFNHGQLPSPDTPPAIQPAWKTETADKIYSLDGFANLRTAMIEDGFGSIPWGTDRNLIETPLFSNDYRSLKPKLMTEFGEVINSLPNGLQSYSPEPKFSIKFDHSYVYNLLFDERDRFVGVVIGLPNATSLAFLSAMESANMDSIEGVSQQTNRMLIPMQEYYLISDYMVKLDRAEKPKNIGFFYRMQYGRNTIIMGIRWSELYSTIVIAEEKPIEGFIKKLQSSYSF